MAAPWPSGLRASEAVAAQLLGVLWLVTINTGPSGAAAAAGGEETIKCEDLRVGQYPLWGAPCLGGGEVDVGLEWVASLRAG